jgi:Xaa-Pro dipeptidase
MECKGWRGDILAMLSITKQNKKTEPKAQTMKIHFETDELAGRRAATITNLENEGLDGLLMFRQESMYYLTGYDTIGFVFFQCLYLGVDGSMFLLTRRPDLLQAQQTSIIDEIHVWRDHEDANPSQDLRDLLLSKGLSGKTLGVELESYGLTAANSNKLHATLEGAVTLVDASYLVTHQRVIKSTRELEYVRRAGELSDTALEAVCPTGTLSLGSANARPARSAYPRICRRLQALPCCCDANVCDR